MTSLQLPPAMAALRPQLADIVGSLETRASYGAVLLSARQGLSINVDDREERVTEQAPAAGMVVTASYNKCAGYRTRYVRWSARQRGRVRVSPPRPVPTA